MILPLAGIYAVVALIVFLLIWLACRTGKKPVPTTVNPCTWCQKENGIIPKAGESHGICPRHTEIMLRNAGLNETAIREFMQQRMQRKNQPKAMRS